MCIPSNLLVRVDIIHLLCIERYKRFILTVLYT